jgi:PAS domain
MADFLYSDFFLTELEGAEPPPVHARFVEMIDYLASIAPAGRLPGRQHIDPCDFPKLLTLINLMDVERKGQDVRFRYRLVGEDQTQAAGRNITGKVVEEAVVPALVPRINGNMAKVLTTRMAVYDRFPMPHPDRQFIDSQRMYYPLASDGETVDVILTLSGYDTDPMAIAAGC